MSNNDDAPPFLYVTACLGCRKPLRIVGESEDDLRELLAESRWQMVADDSMADPINDDVQFLCPDCPVNYLDEPS